MPLHNLSYEEVDANVANETDIEVLRASLFVANTVIKSMDKAILDLVALAEEADEEIIALEDEILAIEQDSERFTLLKFILPSMLQVAARFGPESAGAFASLDPTGLDFALDKSIEYGMLDQLREKFAQEELEQSAQGRRQDA